MNYYRLIVAGLIGLVFGCNHRQTGSPTAETAGPTIVTFAPAKQQSIKWTVEQPGTLLSYESTPLMAKLPGFVKKIHVDIDDPIEGPSADGTKLGTLLAEVSMPEVVEESKQKEAEANQARANIELARKHLTASEAAVTSAKAMVLETKAREKTTISNFERWKSESARVDDLVSRKVIDKQTADETLNQYRSAEGAWEEAKARTTSAEALLKEAEAKRDSTTAEVNAAIAKAKATEADARRVTALLQYAEIRAPYTGVVTGRFIHTGHFLQPSSNKNEPLFTIARTDKVRIAVEVPEIAAGYISKGQKAKIRIPGLGNEEVEVPIARTSWALNNDSRTLRVEFDLDNPNRKYRPGLYVYATIPIEQANTWVLPKSAVLFQDEFAYVHLHLNGKAVRYQTQVGHTTGDTIEVVRLKKAGSKDPSLPWTGQEQVIITHQGPLTDGTTVEIKK